MLIKAANRDLGFKKNANIQLESPVLSSHFSQGKSNTKSKSVEPFNNCDSEVIRLNHHQYRNNFITAVKLWHTDKKITDAKKSDMRQPSANTHQQISLTGTVRGSDLCIDNKK